MAPFEARDRRPRDIRGRRRGPTGATRAGSGPRGSPSRTAGLPSSQRGARTFAAGHRPLMWAGGSRQRLAAGRDGSAEMPIPGTQRLVGRAESRGTGRQRRPRPPPHARVGLAAGTRGASRAPTRVRTGPCVPPVDIRAERAADGRRPRRAAHRAIRTDVRYRRRPTGRCTTRGQPSRTGGTTDPVHNPPERGGPQPSERGQARPERGLSVDEHETRKPPHLAFGPTNVPLHLVFSGLTRLPDRRNVRGVADLTESPTDTLPTGPDRRSGVAPRMIG